MKALQSVALDLANPDMQVRIKSILIPERLASENPDGTQFVCDALCEFICHHACAIVDIPAGPFTPVDLFEHRKDTQEALFALGRRIVRSSQTHLNLSGANLQNADLSQGNWDNTCLSKANLTDANLWAVDASHAQFDGACLDFTDFTDANLRHTDFTPAFGIETEFEGADLSFARLKKAVFRNASFKETRMDLADFESCVLNGSWFSALDLSTCQNLLQDQVDQVFGIQAECHKTHLPRYLNTPSHWHIPPLNAATPQDFSNAMIFGYNQWLASERSQPRPKL